MKNYDDFPKEVPFLFNYSEHVFVLDYPMRLSF